MIHLMKSLRWCLDNQDNFPDDILVAKIFLESHEIEGATYYAQSPEDFEAIEKCVEAAEKILLASHYRRDGIEYSGTGDY